MCACQLLSILKAGWRQGLGHSLGGLGRCCGGRRGYGVCDQDYDIMLYNN